MRVTQEAFDEAVLSNIEDFDMSPEDAVQDAIEQFQAQGLDISHIFKRAPGNSEPPIVRALRDLKSLVAPPADTRYVELPLLSTRASIIVETLKTGSDDEKAEARSQFISQEGMPTLAFCVKALCDTIETGAILEQHREALTAVSRAIYAATPLLGAKMTKSEKDIIMEGRDVFTMCKGVEALVLLWSLLGRDPEYEASLAKTIRQMVSRNEQGKQHFVGGQGLELVVSVCDRYRSSIESGIDVLDSFNVLREVSKLVRGLLLDDDKRVDFSSAPDTAKKMVEVGLGESLLNLLRAIEVPDHDPESVQDTSGGDNQGEKPGESPLEDVHATASTMSDIFAALSKICVKDEVCLEVAESGGLELVATRVNKLSWHVEAARTGCMFLRSLSGNDDVKAKICQGQVLPMLVGLVSAHSGTTPQGVKSVGKLSGGPAVVEVAAATLASAALRSASNCQALANAGALPVLLDALRTERAHAPVQRACCHAVRNAVARSVENKKVVLDLGGEDLIRYTMHTYPEATDHAKAALRDLGCDIDLREDWRGSGSVLENNLTPHERVVYAVEEDIDV